ncbi:tetratricopeptide repeat protein, partial [candidate division KSB1 bacterium]|nr:tetratricopeptide repeat protein [candidate division KSB1 bacterium]
MTKLFVCVILVVYFNTIENMLLAKKYHKTTLVLCGTVKDSLKKYFDRYIAINLPDEIHANGVSAILSCHPEFDKTTDHANYDAEIEFYKRETPKVLKKALEQYFYNNPDTAYKLAVEAKTIAGKKGLEKLLGSSYIGIANTFWVRGDYPAALANYMNALKVFEQINHKKGIASANSGIGIVYRNQGDYPKALKHYFEALEIGKELGDKSKIAVILGNIGIALYAWNKLFGETPRGPDRGAPFVWGEALSYAGVNAAYGLLTQLERLTIPKVLTLDELATFAVLAAIVGSPYRMLQLGVGYTLFPRLRATTTISERRRLICREGLIVAAAGALVTLGVYVACVSLLPVVLLYCPERWLQRQTLFDAPVRRLAPRIERQGTVLTVAAISLALLAAIGASRLELTSDNNKLETRGLISRDLQDRIAEEHNLSTSPLLLLFANAGDSHELLAADERPAEFSSIFDVREVDGLLQIHTVSNPFLRNEFGRIVALLHDWIDSEGLGEWQLSGAPALNARIDELLGKDVSMVLPIAGLAIF